ncbi:MAG: ECF transporter S component [Gammaproteobacteria bacterium]|nr:ECF transporter S component [Gammaproteobacteria bacterium]
MEDERDYDFETNVANEEVDEKPLRPLSIKYQFRTKKGRVRFITRVSMFAALAYVFYAFIKFPLPIFPSFLEVKFANLILILAGLLTGPIGGMSSVIFMIGLKLITVPTTTNFVGELTDLLLSTLIVLPSSTFYLFNHTKKGGLIGILLSFVSWIVFSLVINWTISLPFYLNYFFKGSVEGLVSVLSKTIKGVTVENFTSYYLFLACLPFNALVGFTNCALAAIVYKRISKFLKLIGI